MPKALVLYHAQCRDGQAAAYVAVSALRVDEDAAVARRVPPLPPRQQPPPELDDEAVFPVRLAGDDAAPLLAADSNRRRAVHLVHHGEDAERILPV